MWGAPSFVTMNQLLFRFNGLLYLQGKPWVYQLKTRAQLHILMVMLCVTTVLQESETWLGVSCIECNKSCQWSLIQTNSGLWSWAFRHAVWLLDRFSVVHGTTPLELAHGTVYKGRLAQFREPAFSYVHTTHKGNPTWQGVLALGKAEGQDTYMVFTGRGVMLSRSIRKIATDWKAHLCFYVHFNAPTWCFKTGLGSRIIPTRRTVEPWPASSAEPVGPILPSVLHGADGEAVKQKAQEEKREEGELQAMGVEDVRPKHPEPEAATTSIPVAVHSGQVEINDFLRRIWMMARKRQ